MHNTVMRWLILLIIFANIQNMHCEWWDKKWNMSPSTLQWGVPIENQDRMEQTLVQNE